MFGKTLFKNILPRNNSRISINEQIMDICTQLLFSDFRIKTILVTSASIGDGKSEIAKKCAVEMAKHDLKILLIDTDLDKSTGTSFFKIPNKNGIRNLLIKPSCSEDFGIKKTKIDNLSILPCGNTEALHTNVIKKSEFTNLVNKIKNDFDFVILDGETITKSFNARVIASVVDSTLLVVRQNSTYKRDILKSKSILNEINASLLGVVFNDVKK